MGRPKKQIDPALIAAVVEAKAEPLSVSDEELKLIFAAAALAGLIAKGSTASPEQICANAYMYGEKMMEHL